MGGREAKRGIVRMSLGWRRYRWVWRDAMRYFEGWEERRARGE